MQDELETLLKNFERTSKKIHKKQFMTVFLRDVNAKSYNWCKADITSLMAL